MGLFSKKKDKGDKRKEDVKPTPKDDIVETEGEVERKVELPKIDDERVYQMILGPHVTEKASFLAADRKYVFRVHPSANKIQIKESIQKLYKVDVTGVQIINIPAKQRRMGRRVGYRSGYKKAIVTLKEGSQIDLVA
ncbi:MAG: 50S ribosomal protein L23 [Parcubacteria group bacterium]